MKVKPVIVVRTFHAAVEKVWNVITDKDQMKQWYFDLAEFKPVIGFEFQFYGGTVEKQYLHLCKVIEAIPPKKLSYSWRYDGYEGRSIVTFELFDEGEMTRVILTHTGLQTFPDDNAAFARENFLQGWTHIIGTSLKEFVEQQ
jgi:uncharacterized protein YndB with AHSA1/START domain